MYEIKIESIKTAIREIPDFPKPGILFYDVCTLFRNGHAFQAAIEAFAERYQARQPQFDKIAGIESRGFIIGAALAAKLGCGFVMIRKRGKLPGKTIQRAFELEYGEDHIEMHEDALDKNDRVLLIDDVLATGGTAQAAKALVESAGAKIEEIAFLIELKGLNGRKKLKGADVFSLIHYD